FHSCALMNRCRYPEPRAASIRSSRRLSAYALPLSDYLNRFRSNDFFGSHHVTLPAKDDFGMVDAIIRVIDRLIQLVEIRKRFNRQMFEDHIDPIYKDLQIVIDDYREIILAIETILNRGVKPQKVLEELITRREKYARVRDEIKKYAEALANAKAKLN